MDYDPQWITNFNNEKQHLLNAIGEIAISIEHIGSTSVIGLSAKPIIDILVEVSDLALLDDKTPQLAALGYLAKGENGIAGRRYFQKGDNLRTHHVHAFVSDDAHLVRHLAFRDYLISHPKIQNEYQVIKQQAAKLCGNKSERYMSLKNGFIQTHEPLAVHWYLNKRRKN